MQACDRCHQRKTRCDRRLPRCGACTKASAPCVQTDKFNLRPLPRAYIESLESNLHRAEAEKEQLKEQLANLQAASSSSATLSSHQADQQPAQSSIDTMLDHGERAQTQSAANDSDHNLAEDLVASEVGSLTLKAMGENRYLGVSSGVTFAGILQSLLQSANVPLLSNKGDGNEKDSAAPPFIPKEGIPSSRETAIHAAEAYFNHWHLIFPMIHRPRLTSIVDRTYAEDDYYKTHAFEGFIFDMVLAMGTSSLNRMEWSAASPEVHYTRAMSKLEQVLTMRGLAPLQAVLLLCQYGIFCSLRDTSASMWHLVGIAVRLCVEMGLHREPSLGDASRRGARDPAMELELEMRKRCFWCLYNLDRIVSVTLGRPVGLQDEDIDVSLPSGLDHEDMPTSGSQQPNYTSPFLHVIAIRKLAGKILKTVNCNPQNRNLSDQQRIAIRQGLHDELDAWKADIPKVNLNSPKPDMRPPSSFLWASWYEIPYHNALLLLYRPSPLFPSTSAPTDGRIGEWRAPLDQIFSSSKSAIHLYAELHRTRRLNYSWITLHAVFMAGLAYVYCISRMIKTSARAGGELPACLDYTCVIADTRTCSNVLVAINERWGAARSSCEIFERLSTAIIQDAVKARLKINQIQHNPAAQTYDSGMVGGLAHSLNSYDTGTRAGDTGHAPGSFMPNTSSTRRPNVQNSPPENHQLSAAVGFRQFYQDLQGGPPGSLPYDYEMVPSEVITGFSHDWFEGESVPEFTGSSDMTDLWQTIGGMNTF